MKRFLSGLLFLLLLSGKLQAQTGTGASASDTLKLGPDFCKELAYIIANVEKGQMGKLVDSSQGFGSYRRSYQGKAPLKGFKNLLGSANEGQLNFSAVLDVEKETKEIATELLKRVYSCLSGTYTYEIDGQLIIFTSKTNPALKVQIDVFLGYAKYIKLIVVREAS